MDKDKLTEYFVGAAQAFAEKVHPIYVLFDWRWHGVVGVPTVEDIVGTIVWLAASLDGDAPCSSMTGSLHVGWRLEDAIQPIMFLRFEIQEEHWG